MRRMVDDMFTLAKVNPCCANEMSKSHHGPGVIDMESAHNVADLLLSSSWLDFWKEIRSPSTNFVAMVTLSGGFFFFFKF